MVFQKKSAIIRKEKLIANNIKRGIESKARYEEEKARREAAEQAEAAAQMSPTKSAACCGRRVVKLQFLADSLWCDFCDDSLSLKFVENVERKGLASDFTIRCHRCLLVFRVHSDEKGVLRPDGKPALYPVNLKASLGKYRTTQLECFLLLSCRASLILQRHCKLCPYVHNLFVFVYRLHGFWCGS